MGDGVGGGNKKTVITHGLIEVELALLLFFLRHDFASVVMTTSGADNVRLVHLATVGASHELRRGQCIMRAAAVAAAFGKLPFWMWGHS